MAANDIADTSELLLLLGLGASSTEEERALAMVSLLSATGSVKRHLQYDPVQKTHTEYYPQGDMRFGAREGIWETDDTSAYFRRLSEAVTDELQLTNVPVRNITSLNIDYDGRSGTRSGSFGVATAKTEGVDFWPNYDLVDSNSNAVCRDGVIRSEGRWPDVVGSVKVVYTAGYTAAELHGADTVIDASPILEAVLDEAQRRFLKYKSRAKRVLSGFSGPFTSEKIGEYSYSTDSSILSKLIGGTMDIMPETVHKLSDFRRWDLGVH